MNKLRFYLTIILPICLSVVLGILIVVLNFNSVLQSRTAAKVDKEKSDMQREISLLKERQKELEREEAKYDKIIEENETIISETNALSAELKAYDDDIARASEANDTLDKSLTEKQAYLSGLSDLPTVTDGKKYALKNGNYKCPSDIPSGKYRAEGTGKLYLKDISNRIKDRVDLSTLETGSYVFEISSGESVNTDGVITLTSLK